MAIKIKTKSGGSSKGKSKSTRSSKPKSTSRSKSRGTTKSKSTSASRKRGAATTTKRKSPTPKVDQKIVKKHVTALKRAGNARDKAQAAYDESVEEVFSTVQDALGDGVPMSIVSESVGVSRQWLYNMGNHKGRNGGGKRKSKKRK